jgi:hypothetical protein
VEDVRVDGVELLLRPDSVRSGTVVEGLGLGDDDVVGGGLDQERR